MQQLNSALWLCAQRSPLQLSPLKTRATAHRPFLQVAGGLELLEAAGFSVDVDTSSPTAAASFLDDARLPLAAEALAAVRSALAHQAPASATAAPPPAVSAPPASQPAAQLATASSCGAADEPSSLLAGVVMAGSGAQPEAASSTADSAAAARPTLVLIPAAPDTTVPDWFFDRTPADVKAEYASTVKRRQAGEVLMTRAMREAAARAASRGTQAARFATVRVRLPEGLLVQVSPADKSPASLLLLWSAMFLSWWITSRGGWAMRPAGSST